MFADICVDSPLSETFTYRIPENMNVHAGMRVKVPFGKGGRQVTGFVCRVHDISPEGFEIKEISSVTDTEPVFGEKLLKLCRFTAYSYCSFLGETMSMALPSGKKPSGDGRLPVERMEQPAVKLSEEQQKAADDIWTSSRNGKMVHCIFGITGSGKTEVYIETAKRVIAENRSVIYLVPEISLSSQIYQRLLAVFGDQLVLYHSRLNPNQRLASWKKFFSGEAKIAVGTRSSVFMQAPALGLIIIDEEQDLSFKEHSSPRYNARRLAMYRSREEKAILILGSATPSVETMYACSQGRITLHRLTRRFGGALLPSVEILSMQKGKGDELSPLLRIRTKEAVEAGGQALFLLNRRGFAPVVICEDCGEVIRCPHCSISLNFHRGGSLVCHYCGYQMRMPDVCPSCSSDAMKKMGAGTQKLEETAAAAFPGFRIRRLDQDSVRGKDRVFALIDEMQSGKVDLLIGTQMVAKGFDFPDVSVAGILSADLGMNLPDFRASERLFSLLVQAAGRAGRGSRPGKVFIQTMDPENPLFRYVKNQDYPGFYMHELEIRKALNYPPFSRLLRMLVRGKDEKAVGDAAENLRDQIDLLLLNIKSDISVLGPAPAPLEKIGDNFRCHLILKGTSPDLMRRTASEARKNIRLSSGMYLEIDADPAELM